MRRTFLPLLAMAALAVGACTSSAPAAWTYPPVADGALAGATSNPASEAPAASAPATAGEVLGALEIQAIDLGFAPSELTIDQPGRYAVTLTNAGQIPHDITFPDGTVGVANAGETVTVEVDIPQSGYTFLCSIPGHADAGMTGGVTVSGTAAEPTADPGDDHSGPAPTTEIAADPNAPAPVTFDPAAPPLMEGKVHELDLVMTEELKTIAPGFVQKVWTFGGSVPGPVMRVKVGDTIRVNLTNATENQMSHSLDYHSSQVAWNDEMRSIAPGESLVYDWTAEYAGIWMYHCGTSPALHHIANGMYGMVIVEPEEGLPPVDNEFAIVQSEWYLGKQGEVSDLGKASEANPAPDFVLFNGVANQYADAPIKVGTGESVRVFVLNAGPSTDSSFHVVGAIFNTVIKEGMKLSRGNAGNWGSQAVDLSPAQGAMVEFTLAEDGLYPMVTHAFNFVGRGALGLFQAGDGDPLN